MNTLQVSVVRLHNMHGSMRINRLQPYYLAAEGTQSKGPVERDPHLTTTLGIVKAVRKETNRDAHRTSFSVCSNRRDAPLVLVGQPSCVPNKAVALHKRKALPFRTPCAAVSSIIPCQNQNTLQQSRALPG